MIPDWLVCELCLWHEELQDGPYCFYEKPPMPTHNQARCPDWECNACGGGIALDINHNDCIIVEVELED